MFFRGFLRFLTHFGALSGSVLRQKSGQMEHGKTSGKVVEYFHAGHATNSAPGPMWSLKRIKKSAIPPGLAPRGPLKEAK